MNKQLIQLAANVGIDARNKTLAQIKEEHKNKKHPLYSDQHDAYLMEYIERHKYFMGA
jgi:hypothetical protein